MLEEHGTARDYKDGESIFREGERGTEMYVISSGKVKIFRDQKGQEVTFAILEPGDFFGEMALFSNNVHSSSAQAIGKTELIAVDKKTFMSLIKEPVVWRVMETMAARLRKVDDALENLT